MKAVIIIFLGGGAGSVLRYFFSLWFSSETVQIPWHTFLANFVSCIILGFLLALSRKNNLGTDATFLLMIGFCGGFSTFSTFSMENVKLIEAGNWILALAYISASVLLCIFGIMLGMFIQNKISF